MAHIVAQMADDNWLNNHKKIIIEATVAFGD
jgi:hypothetical protein